MPPTAQLKSAPAKKPAGAEPVSVSAKLRKAHPWFEFLVQKVQEVEVKRRRKVERARGPQLAPEEVSVIADELEELQRQISPLDARRKTLAAALLAHWAHTGVEEIEHPLGKTLISTSFEMALDPGAVREAVDDATWRKTTALILEPLKLLSEGKRSSLVRAALERAALVRKLKVAITPPSSRRPKSGSSDEQDGE